MLSALRAVGAALLLALSFSCFTYHEKLTFNESFSGEGVQRLTVPSLLASQLDPDFYKLEEKLKKEPEKVNGVTLTKVRRIQEGNTVTYEVYFTFKDLKSLAKYLSTDLREESITVKEEGEFVNFERVSKKKEREVSKEEEEALALYPLSEYYWTYEAVFPYRVVETNGKLENDRKVVWKFDFYTILTAERLDMEAKLKKPSFVYEILKRLGLHENETVLNLLKKLGLY
ncbi:MAG: hypothetical protein GXO03_04575 [Aquificae bacterium]|nr:hypothetical protein [Aquificota bacterium]